MTGKGLTGDARLTADAGIWLPASLSVSVKRRMDFLLFHALFFGLCHLHNPGFRFPPFFMLSAAFPCCLMPLPPSHTAFPISMRILDFHLPWSAKKQRQLHPAAACRWRPVRRPHHPVALPSSASIPRHSMPSVKSHASLFSHVLTDPPFLVILQLKHGVLNGRKFPCFRILPCPYRSSFSCFSLQIKHGELLRMKFPTAQSARNPKMMPCGRKNIPQAVAGRMSSLF